MSVIETSDCATIRFELRVDGQTPESWHGILELFADANIYQTWAYGAVRWGERSLSHLVLLREGLVVAAAQIRIIRMPVLPTGVAYLRWGPLCHLKSRDPDPTIVKKMLEYLKEEYCKRRGMTLQLVPNVFPDTPRSDGYWSALRSNGFHVHSDLPHYRTVLVDLTPSEEIIRKRLDKKWRNHLNRSEKNELELEIATGPEAYHEFECLYQIMVARKKFESTVDVQEFRQIQERLHRDEKMQVFIARKDDEAVGAAVCSLMGDTAIYLLGATNERARELRASFFLQWQIIRWLKERHARWYDLCGIDPVENPGGYEFKIGFGGSDSTQIPGVWTSCGLFGRALNSGIKWLRRIRA